MKVFPSEQNKWIQPQMELSLILLSTRTLQESNVALRARTVLVSAWG